MNMTHRMTRLFVLALSVVLMTGAAAFADPHEGDSAPLQSLPFRISILSSTGAPVSEFVATLHDQHIDNVKMGPDGNIWLARADNSHGNGVPNPDDMVAIFDMGGTELGTITGGGMRHPLSMGWDGDGNIYIPAEDMFFASDIYKYTSEGVYLTKFHTQGWTLIDEYNDMVTAVDDRLYVSSWHGTGNDPQMTEFNTAGQTINTFSNTGPLYFHRDMDLGPSNTTFWVRTPRNGSGDDLIREFDLAGNQIDIVNSSLAIPGSNLDGLEVDPGGSIFVLNRNDKVLYELDADGAVLGQTVLQGLSDWITDFTFGPAGEILVANQDEASSGVGDVVTVSPVRFDVFPNPSRGRTEISFSTTTALGKLSVYDVGGHLIRSFNLASVAGRIVWDGRNSSGRAVTPGVYLLRLTDGRTTASRRLTILQ
jgi:sugar lactone lactonase YvrE